MTNIRVMCPDKLQFWKDRENFIPAGNYIYLRRRRRYLYSE